MSDYSGIYLFFALYCGVPTYDDPVIQASYVVAPVEEDHMGFLGFPAACYIATDPGFPPPWLDVPGVEHEPVYYDI